MSFWVFGSFIFNYITAISWLKLIKVCFKYYALRANNLIRKWKSYNISLGILFWIKVVLLLRENNYALYFLLKIVFNSENTVNIFKSY